MNIDDEIIADRLRNLEDHGSGRDAPVADLLKRGRASRVRRKLGTAGLSVLALAALSSVAAGSSPPSGPAAQNASNVSLALAAHETAETSFHVTITKLIPTTAGMQPLVLNGAFDPVHQNGYLANSYLSQEGEAGSESAGGVVLVQVAGACYSPLLAGEGRPQQFEKMPCTFLLRPAFGTANPIIADPDALLEQLSADGSAKLVGTTGSGARAIETWRYSYEKRDESPSGAVTDTITAGTVTVDAATHHVTSLTWALSTLIDGTFQPNAAPTTYEFSDFGAPVTVTVPVLAKCTSSLSNGTMMRCRPSPTASGAPER